MQIMPLTRGFYLNRLAQEEEPTIGQRLYSLTREALHNLLDLSQNLFVQGKSTEQILEVMMPS